MLIRIKQLGQSKFVRNVAIVATGTAGAQAITMAFAPIITRLYGPEAFGLLGIYMAIITVLMPVAALTYPIAIVLAKTDADAKGIAKLSAILALSIAVMTSVLLLVAGDWIAEALSMQAVAGFMLLIPVAMLFSAFQQIFLQWLVRKKQFRTTARVEVMKALISNSVIAGVGVVHPAGAALIIITAVSQGFHAVLLWFGIRSSKEALPQADQPTGTVRELARRHRDFPAYRAPQVALNALTQGLPVLMLAVFFGPAAAGFFALTRSVLAAPATLVGQSVGNVFYPKATELYENPTELQRILYKATFSLVALGGMVFLPVLVAGPWLFSLVFGLEWREAGEFARWIAIWMTFSLSARPIISTIPVLGMQKFFLTYEVTFLSLKFASLCLGVYLDEVMFSVASYSLVSSVFYILLFFMVCKRLAGKVSIS
ncbi:oligosaccharide flippase family protein [Halopseudomonas sp. Lyrl_26]|uniref:lipopolysaccharide biosynthesis protein n=1 Tax=Halopseudomonas sp. Lyrl_26 TaxID=3110923 RepID=UPI003F7E3384